MLVEILEKKSEVKLVSYTPLSRNQTKFDYEICLYFNLNKFLVCITVVKFYLNENKKIMRIKQNALIF